MTIPAIIIFSHDPPEPTIVGGLPLVDRHIAQLYRLGVKEFYILDKTQTPQANIPFRAPMEASIHTVPCPSDNIAGQVQNLPIKSGHALILRSDCIIDPRLLDVLLKTDSPRWLQLPAAPDNTLPAAARLSPETTETWHQFGVKKWLKDIPELKPELLDTYSPAHRGCVAFYVMPIKTRADAKATTKMLIRAAQKCTLDLPALILDPIFENRLVYWLCKTQITPNQITLFTVGLGIFIAWLFLNGYLRVGILLAYVVEVLDGVDGKLARTKLKFSRLGEQEHIMDFFMEQAWYLCITMFLFSSTGNDIILWIGGGLMACDLADKLLYYLIHTRLNRELDELETFDRTFRIIGGRRNIYAWMFLFGFWAGYPVQTLGVVCFWALITVGVHGIRVVYHLRTAFQEGRGET